MAKRGDGLPEDADMGVLSRAMLEAVQAAGVGVTITVFEPQGMRVVYANEASANIIGYSMDEIVHLDPLSFIVPEDATWVRDRADQRRAGEKGTRSYEVRAVRRDGKRIHIEVTATSTHLGGTPAVFAVVVDVTARREAERARSRAESRFIDLVSVAPEPFGIIRDDLFVYANAAYAKMLGYGSVGDLYGVPLGQIVHPDQLETLHARHAFILEGGDAGLQVYAARRLDGSTVLIETSCAVCEWEGRPAIVSMARDVSARKALEAQLLQADRLAAIGTMAAGVAHEINNPLAYLMLNLDWIARKLPESAQEPASVEALIELLREARAGAERVASIVRELRAFSRADSETRRRVDLAAVARSAIRIAGHELRHRARVSTSFEPAGAVWANEARLEQVVLNLLLNAAHAMPEGRGDSNEIHLTVRPDGPDLVVLEVVDNGEGIPPEILPRIFDPFFTTKPRGVGMGLGLSICHGIVMALGGQITARSTPHEGTTFRVILPTTHRDDAEERPPQGVPADVRGPRARVLVVDDDVPIANTMRELLGAHHDVTATTDARDALVVLQAERDFDVIFCDLMMPEMSGIDFYEELRKVRPAMAKRIVFMTGGAFTSRVADFLTSTENRRIEKPFNLGLIERIVDEMTARRVDADSA